MVKKKAKHNLRLTEVALRWVQHHGVLTPEDGVILGASSIAQLNENIQDRCARDICRRYSVETGVVDKNAI